MHIYMEYLQFCLLSRGAFEGMWMQKIPAPLYIDRKSIVLAIRLCRKVSYSVFGINYACNIASRPGGGYTLGSDLLRNQRSPNSNSEWWTTRGVHSVARCEPHVLMPSCSIFSCHIMSHHFGFCELLLTKAWCSVAAAWQDVRCKCPPWTFPWYRWQSVLELLGDTTIDRGTRN